VGTRREGPLIGAEVIRLRETSSTIDEARRLAEQAAPHGTVVMADRQTAGRGRRGRTWHTVPGKSLAATIIIRQMPDPAHVGMAGMTAALAVVRAARDLLHVRLRTKWPNDVVHGGRKLAGTLAQKTGGALLLSIGLNINGAETDLPPEMRAEAVTLEMVAGHPLDRHQVANCVLAELSGLWDQLLRCPHEVVRQWDDLDIAMGALVRIAEPGGKPLEGRALGIDESGRLRVRTANGAVRTPSAGDLTLVQGP
jgi:BirA family biotin operon repressor/biotin-[acetyl-CoA-carboxylase] ligase